MMVNVCSEMPLICGWLQHLIICILELCTHNDSFPFHLGGPHVALATW
uniref:Uncharacterized protein n=1 Tax=Rhizophora mucronata TaxID=61149 RepID=A0A2P2MY35_RHIMU